MVLDLQIVRFRVLNLFKDSKTDRVAKFVGNLRISKSYSYQFNIFKTYKKHVKGAKTEQVRKNKKITDKF